MHQMDVVPVVEHFSSLIQIPAWIDMSIIGQEALRDAEDINPLLYLRYSRYLSPHFRTFGDLESKTHLCH